jgi:hypothetical protein
MEGDGRYVHFNLGTRRKRVLSFTIWSGSQPLARRLDPVQSGCDGEEKIFASAGSRTPVVQHISHISY